MDWRCVVIVGRSGSGKSTLAAKIVEKRKKIVVVNSPVDEAMFEGKELSRISSLPWESVPLEEETQVGYLIEDVQRIKKDRQERLFKLFNVTARHNDSTCVVICHSLLNTGVYSLLNFTSEIVLTSDKTNTKILRHLLKENAYDDGPAVVRAFHALPKWEYLVLRTNERSWFVVDQNLKKIPVPMDETAVGDGAVTITAQSEHPAGKEHVMSYLEHASPATKRLAEFLLNNLPHGCVRLPDLRLTVKGEDGALRDISFLDYVLTLDSAEEKPEKIMIKLHKLLLSKMCYPKRLVTNKILSKMQ